MWNEGKGKTFLADDDDDDECGGKYLRIKHVKGMEGGKKRRDLHIISCMNVLYVCTRKTEIESKKEKAIGVWSGYSYLAF